MASKTPRTHGIVRTAACGLAALVIGIITAGGHGALAPEDSVVRDALEDRARGAAHRAARWAPPPAPAEHAAPVLRRSDLAGIKAAGVLRVLSLPRHTVAVPGTLDVRKALVERFCEAHGIEPVWITRESPAALREALVEGGGDLIVDPLPAAFDQDPQLGQTLALASRRAVAVARAGEQGITSPGDFAGRRIAVKRGSPGFGAIERLAGANAGIRLHVLPRYVDEQVLRRGVRRGEFDVAIVEGGAGALEPELRRAFTFAPPRPYAWTVRASNAALQAALDRHLASSPLLAPAPARRRGDLDTIDSRGVLRVITRAQRDSFYLHEGATAGFAHELIARFAGERGLRVRIVLADTPGQMLAALERGQGDIIAARGPLGTTGAGGRFAFSRAYHHVTPTLLMRAGAAQPSGAGELAELRIAHQPDLADPLVAQAVAAEQLPQGLESLASTGPEQALDALERGAYDALIVDSHFVPRILEERPALAAAMSLDHHYRYRFVVRRDSPALLAAIDDYVVGEYRSAFYNIVERRYFARPDFERPAAEAGPISAYDGLARRYAERYAFDWRLILAQMYEESRFDPAAVSDVGARGLMQVMPETAREFGFRDLHDPDRGIHAGVHYLDWLRSQLERSLPVMERNWLALAAYHAGPYRIRSARREAERMGLDPNRWFGHVEKALARIAGRRTEDGERICRCGQTVAYLRAIRSRYDAYLQLRAPLRYASLGEPLAGG